MMILPIMMNIKILLIAKRQRQKISVQALVSREQQSVSSNLKVGMTMMMIIASLFLTHIPFFIAWNFAAGEILEILAKLLYFNSFLNCCVYCIRFKAIRKHIIQYMKCERNG